MTRAVVLIDNLDSFSFNLVEAFERLGSHVRVLRNTADPALALAMARDADALIVLSPGPGRPEDSGCCLPLIAMAKGKVPLLGVCLGHQALIHEAGGRVERAPAPMHGKVSRIAHDGGGAFAGLDSPLPVGRYHSLGSYEAPARFTIHARHDGVVMAVSDRDQLQTGLQFHPESILTPQGDVLLSNILEGA
jgi:anthranilate synthase component II